MSSYFLYAANYWSKNPSFLALPQKQKEEERFSKRWGWTQTNAYKVFKMPETLEDRVRLLRESIRIVLVRHPFSSQYRKGEQEIFDVIRKNIIKTYRSKNIKKSSEDYPTFQEFVTYLIDNEKLIQDDRNRQVTSN
ncbi:hypothetical protein Avbf_06060 [Armadillidium vulgare]|nr:hypothetical protein Avbf_06060 [Armadillidium vulgare]